MASGIIRGTTSNQYIDVWLEWNATAYPADNKSVFECYLYYQRNNTGYTTDGTWTGSITVNGQTYTKTKTGVSLSYNSNTEVMNCVGAVEHNTDGTKAITISATGSIGGTTLTATYLSGTVELDTIYKNATISAAPNFNDEENPTITYSNKAGSSVSSLQACIADSNGEVIYVPYRDISKTGTSYTFNLSNAERKILRAATTGKSRTVKFYVKTVLNGSTYYSSLAKTFSIVNGNPTLAPTVVDTNAETIALTGNNNRLIKYYSNAKYTTGAAAIKEATLKSQKVVCGSKSATAATGTLNAVESGNFVFTATDSRGFSTSQTVKKTIVEYVKLTCNVAATTPTTSGEMVLKISGNYFNGSFGAATNVLIVNYRSKQNDGEYGGWNAVEVALNGNTYTASIPITGLDYQSKYTFQARAADKLITIDSAEKSVKTTPVFDWGSEDFRFNVPVFFGASNKVLWKGQNYMNASQTAYLSSPVSEQSFGIVLIFSNYDTSSGTGVANNYDWHCFFVPKELVALHSGTGHTFNMMSQAFGDIASKYLYISDTEIGGNDVNTTNGTRNGITYNNGKYVMRYVLGV